MIKNLPPPTEAEECWNTAEILRDLAAQVRFGSTRTELVRLAEILDRLAAHAEPHGRPFEERAQRPANDTSVQQQ